jgi:hypothetical protein
MSFEVYLQSFNYGDFAGLPRQSVRAAFGAYLTETDLNYWRVHYDEENWCTVGLSADAAHPEFVHGLAVHRPCADRRLWDALAAILGLGNNVLYFPDCRAPLVARTSAIDHLPSDLIEALGRPVVVLTGEQIQHEVETS